jgi:tetratricopeptide (TPR) repeat protein
LLPPSQAGKRGPTAARDRKIEVSASEFIIFRRAGGVQLAVAPLANPQKLWYDFQFPSNSPNPIIFPRTYGRFAMDAYTPCPCGSGKKIKFCCGVDLIPDIEKLDRMLEGEQRRAALEHIARMPAKLRDKPSIWAKKIQALLAIGDVDAYDTASREMLAAFPDNPVALACVAPMEVKAGRPREGIAMLQRAIDSINEDSPGFGLVLMTGGVLTTANELLRPGHIWAARAHLRVVDLWMEDRDNPGSETLQAMDRDPSLPLVWKDDGVALHCPAEAPYKTEYEAATQLAEEGKWAKALERFEALASKHPKDATILRAVAAQRASLADDEGAADAFRQAAAIEGTPLEDAVECELYALAISAKEPDALGDSVDLVSVSFSISDFDALLPKLLSDKRLVRLRVDLASLATEDQPAPRDAFRLLDRAALEASAIEGDAAADIRREDVPNVLGEVLLYGRETDREARIELEIRRDQLEQAQAILAEISEGLIGDKVEEKVLQQIGQTQHTLMWRWYWPPGVRSDIYERLSREEFRQRLLESWPQNKARGAGGKTYAEAARDSDPHLRRLVLAAILDLESNHRAIGDGPLFNDLRAKLGLPAATEIDPFRVDLDHISLLRLSRLPAQLMPDDQLMMAFNLAITVRAATATIRLGEEIVERTSIDADRRTLVYLSLARGTSDTRRTLEYLHRGREIDVGRGKSPAVWLLEELAISLSRPDKDRPIDRLIEEIMAHRQEPGVAHQLMRILTAFGVIDPAMMHSQPASDPGFSIGGMELKAQAPGFGETVAAGAPSEEKKSGLWLPGMD